ncbi:tandem-95 repeat protein [Aequorivita echinoideorum]|uniref:Tandem-95 repeat protein n=1 Tax=Aequorivita echinoideorum TaxID=1549647 RepID=A0ABS5S571_9FLAO|nr:Ig-like domain-containing protein [Aequorivita echinoideorum]MBT0608351.1 tandem-95 repeat protein [Aequorivita echinoideorum]
MGTNDQNPDGPAGTEVFTLVSGPSNGALVFNADGTYTYTPNGGYLGADSFEYQVCDGGSPVACDTATVYIEVQPLGGPDNAPPVANADTNTTEVGVPVSGNVLSNDYDPDGDTFTVTGNTAPSNGTVVIDPVTGAYTYTPAPGFEGQDTFEYTICDSGAPSLCDTATVTITVVPDAGNITVANDDSYYGYPDADITGNVSDNDSDPEGDAQTVSTVPVSGPANGTLVLNADGSFTYTPGAGFSGTDQFVYSVSDDGSPVATDQATVYIIIDPNAGGNEILAIDDINDTFVDLPVSGDVGTNDQNPDGPAGTEVFTLVSGPSNGALVFNADGTYTYTPNGGYLGADSFEYQVCDGGSPVACDTATVTIKVVGDPILENDPPIANNDTNVTEIDVPVSGNVIVNDYDLDNDPIVITQNTSPINGTVVLNPDGTYIYTPNLGYVGEDTFEYTICDNGNPALCDTAIVTIYIIADEGNITVANDDSYYTEINQPINGNVLINDSDPEGDTQTVDVNLSPISGPNNGTVTINSNGSFVYTPNTDFTGTDQFVYSIFDNGNPVATNQATVYILIEETPAPAIAIIKTGVFNDENGDDCTNVAETITYTFTVTNEGNVPLDNISVTDPLLETPNPIVPIVLVSGDNGDGILQEGETWIFEANFTLTQNNIDSGEISNQATVEGTGPDQTIVTDLSDENSILEDDPTVIGLCQQPAIDIVKTSSYDDGGDCSQPGELIEYTFSVTNQGNVSLSAVSVDDALLGGNVPGPVSGDTDGDGELDVDETWIYTGSYAITQADIDAGEVVNTATAEATAPDGTLVSDASGGSVGVDDPTVTVLCQQPAIALIKIATPSDENGNGCADLGETIVYTFDVKNTGNVELTDVIITDPLVAVIGGPITLAAGANDTTTFSAIYTVTQVDVDLGLVENQATAEGSYNGGVVIDISDDSSYLEDDPTVVDLCDLPPVEPSITLEKTGVFDDNNGNLSASAGETVSYVFSVTNTGNVPLYNITIDDQLPGIIISGGPIAELLPGETDSSTFTAVYTLVQQDIINREVVNQANVFATDPDNNEVSDLSDDPTDLTNEDLEGDGEPDDPTVVILPVVEAGNFEIFNGITPNGDGYNDYFWIQGIHNYPNNNVKIYNRWGVLVYETDGYGRGDDDSENTFRGISEGRVTVQQNKELPTGTYYYILTFPAENPGKSSYNGYLYINR